MSERVTTELKQQDWPRIIKELVAYTHLRLSLWGLLKNRHLKGYEPKDIAFRAIQAVLEGEWRWDPDKSDLLPYLKYHVVKGLTANFAKSAEITTSVDSTRQMQIEQVDEFSHEDELNASMVMDEINSSIQSDPVLIVVVDGLSKGLKRSEICELNDLDTGVYDNALRRLRTKLIHLEKRDLYTIHYGKTKSK
jgi:hypothetical protein